MATTDKNTLKSWFLRGLKPLASQFAAWLDSYWHKNEKIPIDSIDGLQNTLNSKADSESIQNQIQEAIENLTVNDGTLTQKGVVQLSETLENDSTKAATPKLVKQVSDDVAATLEDYYTSVETDEKIAQQIVGLTWKDWVQSFVSLSATYPNPETGWLVPVADDSIIYKYNGTEWVDSKLGSIPAGLLKFTTGSDNKPYHNSKELATIEYVNEHTPTIPDGTTTQKGIVQLTDTIEEDSTKAVTGAAVKAALKDTSLVGEQGPQGAQGTQGLSAFEVWLQQPGNSDKTVSDFFNSLKGATGATGAAGAAGANGAAGMSAYEQWRQLSGNTLKTFDDFLEYLAKRDGFMHNVLFYNYNDAQISFPYAGNINTLTLDNNIQTFEYSLDSGATYTAASGAVNINVGANAPIYLKVTFKTGQITGVITIKGTYL
jgi:hypothetical protein